MTRFSSTFRKDGDCEAVHTQKTRQVFLQPEPNIWMVLTVSIGWVSRMRESGPVREYQSEGVQDVVLRACLSALYRSLALRHHSFAQLHTSKGIPGLKDTLDNFLTSYMSSVELGVGDILAVWSGVSFLPLDRQTFLRIHCCLSLLQATFPAITHTAFFYNHHVVWCGMAMEDLRSLSQYLTTQLLPASRHHTTTNAHHHHHQQPASSSSSTSPTSYLSRFMGSAGVTPSLRVHVTDNKGEQKPHHLLLYSLAGITVCITFDESETLTPNLYEKIDRLLEPKISQLASDIGEQASRKAGSGGGGGGAAEGGGGGGGGGGGSSSGTFRYVYHNHMNLATKSTVHAPHQPLPAEVMRTIADMHCDMKKCRSGELVVKTAQDHWVVGRCGDGREFYVVLNHKNANLVEVTDEVSRMCASHFSNIFMIE
ncbi:vacuolar fusion protein CCZ1 homolog [Eriocheir sinensis]|uniref:vacuolar fusion protein CCZ1 homolog n=1 Tax=Eriocheir sinensis TaxID=95602 RepID=UPI0021C68A76|nr:vacuolar fusion protein CCZ1 homolog [Eriocheir sinensis]